MYNVAEDKTETLRTYLVERRDIMRYRYTFLFCLRKLLSAFHVVYLHLETGVHAGQESGFIRCVPGLATRACADGQLLLMLLGQPFLESLR